MNYLPTIIFRHVRENLKKCSLSGLESRSDVCFFTYPKVTFTDTSQYLLLDVAGEPLSDKDRDSGLVLLDGTWRLVEKMQKNIGALRGLPRRSIPAGFTTAYPRRQDDCPDPEVGLASIEALFVAHLVTGRPVDGLLDNYYWKSLFLEKNRQLCLSLRNCYRNSSNSYSNDEL